MKRSLMGLVVLSMLAIAPPASAAPPTAADLAADCNDDGIVTITAELRTIGGAGTLTQVCVIVMAEGAEWYMRDATLGGCCGLVIGSAERDTLVRILRSTIDLSGPVQISPGCCAGVEPGRSEAGATVHVIDATLRGTSVEVSASIAHHYGRALVRRSTLEATSAAAYVGASVSGGVGWAVVQDSTLISAGDTTIITGRRGTTRSLRNIFTVAGSTIITTGINGTCGSAGNTPAASCS